MPRTLFDKIWDSHVVHRQEDGTCVLYIDRHLVHEVTSPQAFEGLRMAGRQVRRPDATLAVADHNVPTSNRAGGIDDPESKIQVDTLTALIARNSVSRSSIWPMSARASCISSGRNKGSHYRARPLCVGTVTPPPTARSARWRSVSARRKWSMCLRPKHCLCVRSRICGLRSTARCCRVLRPRTWSLAIIGTIGTAGGTGHVIEYAGEAVRALTMEGRMTVCNMSIEGGARAGLIAPDEKTFDYLKGRPMAPTGEAWAQAEAWWRTLPSDAGASYDKEVTLNAGDIPPTVSWGTSPQDVVPITAKVPGPDDFADEARAQAARRALDYMGLVGRDRDVRRCDRQGLHRFLHQRAY